MNPQARAFFDRVRASVSQMADLRILGKWIAENTRHPKDNMLPWSYEGHEYQIEILSDPANESTIRKCSQVGMSELSVRLVLALLAVFQNHTAIYTLPTSKFATKFAKGRIDPVVTASPVLASMMSNENNSSELKQLGTSFLYISGSFGQSSAISVPADALIMDEVDFSNQKALSTFSSRLGHAKNGGIKRRFSTPTVEGFGVSASFDQSSQGYYSVKCSGCHDWVVLDFYNDVDVPGYQDTLLNWEKEDLLNPSYKVDEATYRCPECRHDLTRDLLQPERRQWIHKRPGVEHRGYQVMPYDVPSINTAPLTLRQINEYERKADWVNFKLGLPYEDADNSFVKEAIERNTTLEWVRPRRAAAHGCVFGLDVGKTSWLTVGKRTGPRALGVIHAERIRADGEDTLLNRMIEVVDEYGIMKGVIDAGPDFSTAMRLIEALRFHLVWACYYVRQKKGTLSWLDMKDDEQVVNAARTPTIDELAKETNSGRILFARMPEMPVIADHLRAMKRVVTVDGTGELIANWVSTGDDHYAHSLNYLKIADKMCDYHGKHPVIPALPMAAKVRMKSG